MGMYVKLSDQEIRSCLFMQQTIPYLLAKIPRLRSCIIVCNSIACSNWQGQKETWSGKSWHKVHVHVCNNVLWKGSNAMYQHCHRVANMQFKIRCGSWPQNWSKLCSQHHMQLTKNAATSLERLLVNWEIVLRQYKVSQWSVQPYQLRQLDLDVWIIELHIRSVKCG